MKEYSSVSDAAESLGISNLALQLLCQHQRIPEAVNDNGNWYIPKQYVSNCLKLDKTISFEDVCKLLSISASTGKNWVKLGKLAPTKVVNKRYRFSFEYIETLIKSIQENKLPLLKSRRNKKQANGFYIYKDYIDDSAGNTNTADKLISYYHSSLNPSHIKLILAEYAIQLIFQSVFRGKPRSGYLKQYIQNNLNIGIYKPLIDDLISDISISKDTFNFLDFALSQKIVFVNGEDFLGFLYISLNNISDRKPAGAYYTPISVVKNVIDELMLSYDLNQIPILDPCCGTGNFLMYLSTFIKSPLFLYGQDIDMTSVKITRINMALQYPAVPVNVLYDNFTCGDTLKGIPGRGYKLIIGNPPWGYSFSDSDVFYLLKKYKTAIPRGSESFSLFIECSLGLVKDGGVIAFVLPESVLNVKTHSTVRELILSASSLERLKYIGNVFSGVQTPAIIMQLKKTASPTTLGCTVTLPEKRFVVNIKRDLFKDNICFNMTDEEYKCLLKIKALNNQTSLKDNADFALGIVTGDNKGFISNFKTKENEIILKGRDVFKYNISKPENYIAWTPSSFQQAAPEAAYRTPEKLIYRFISNNLVFAYDNKQTLTLNSCNILVPRFENLNIKYIMAVLNSRVAAFYCNKTYNSIKLLRSHLEDIPIPAATAAEQDFLIKMVDKISDGSAPISGVYDLYDEIDNFIMDLYEINSSEKEIIYNALTDKNLYLNPNV